MTIFNIEKLKKTAIGIGTAGVLGAAMLGGAGMAYADDTPAPDPGAPIIRAASGPFVVLGTPGGDTVVGATGVAVGGTVSKVAPIVVTVGIVAKVTPIHGGSACANAAANQKSWDDC